MNDSGTTGLSRRERQILDILYSRGRATAAEILAALPDPPSYSAIRALLRILEQKGHIRHESDGPRYVYTPRVSRQKARASALKHMLATFFDGSACKMSTEELDQLQALIERTRSVKSKETKS